MNKYTKNINRIEFVITNSCTGKCKHCSQGEHVSNEHIDTELAVQAVHDICNDYKIDSLMTFGGEPKSKNIHFIFSIQLFLITYL